MNLEKTVKNSCLVALILIINSFLTINFVHAQSLNFSEDIVQSKLNEEKEVDIVFGGNVEENVVKLRLGVDSSINIIDIEPSEQTISVSKNNENNIFSVDIAKTSGNFINGEKIAKVTFKLNTLKNSTIEIHKSSQIGTEELQSYNEIQIQALNDDGSTFEEIVDEKAQNNNTLGLFGAGFLLAIILVYMIRRLKN